MSVIDDYLASINQRDREQLERVRTIAQACIPDAEEVMSYGMPGFKYQGAYVLGFAAFKDHLSIFPTSAPVAALQAKLTDFKVSKGTIQFTANKPVPESTIKALIALRLEQIRR